jgi:hypothetical protein
MDEIDFSQDGINHINIIKFLLEIESWNDLASKEVVLKKRIPIHKCHASIGILFFGMFNNTFVNNSGFYVAVDVKFSFIKQRLITMATWFF